METTEKPEILVIDWKTCFFEGEEHGNPEESPVYRRVYKPMEEEFSFLLYFGRGYVPEELIGNPRINAVILHTSYFGNEDLAWLMKFPDSTRRYVLSTVPDRHKKMEQKHRGSIAVIGYPSLKSRLREDILGIPAR
ncbi:MAG TPA: hypothetical protein VJH95_05895 [Candidatus Nanoarchaeia archaeon]|nr:hypothetical protein [Candidatus Nanoarchaeia archaeon]